MNGLRRKPQPFILWRPMGFPSADYVFPTVTQFQTQYVRDFPFGAASNQVQDVDVSNAMAEAAGYINYCLFPTQAQFTLGALRLSAHYLVMNLRASSQGLWGTYPWMTQSKSAGPVSQGMAIPERILNNPMLAILTNTNYGTQYLYMIIPQLVGQIFPSYGGTNY